MQPDHKKKKSSNAKKAHTKGLFAEMAASFFLKLKGYRLLEKRFISPFGEIDLILQHQDTLIFTEVKARRTTDDAAEAITPRQQHRIRQAALFYLARQGLSLDQSMRFDAVLITPFKAPVHIMDAF